MQKIIICPNPDRDLDFKCTKRICALFQGIELETVISPVCERPVLSDELFGMKVRPIEDAVQNADFMIVLGGDGTILHAARQACRFGIPVIGVNLGSKGFIADLEPEQIDLLPRILKGEYVTERRFMLDVSVLRDDRTVFSDYALNDVVVGGVSRMVKLSVYGDGKHIMHFPGDGVVVATPTGSTAYSMSAGGPIVEPTAENIIVTPICPHILTAKSFVLAPDRTVDVVLGSLSGKNAYMSVDGGVNVILQSGDLVRVSRSAYYTKLIALSGKSFYEKVSEKLGDR